MFKTLSSSDDDSLALYLAFALLLVAVAFVRALTVSSTGLRVTGDGVYYMEMARSLELSGRAPFVYRPLYPLTVGMLSAGHPFGGFAVGCGASMLAVLLLVYRCCADRFLAFLLAPVLLVNYQFLFNASYIARMDVFVLALQLTFVWMALEGRQRAFLLALPLAALVKEGLLLSLLPVALLAFFSGRRRPWVPLAGSTAAFLLIHLGVRQLAVVESSARGYAEGMPEWTAALGLFRQHIGFDTIGLVPLAAFGGLLIPLGWALWAGLRGAASADMRLPVPRLMLGGLLVFNAILPLLIATDLHRALFELFTPVFAFVGFRVCGAENRGVLQGCLGLALLASVLPYSLEAIGQDHLYLQILKGRPSSLALVTAAVVLGLSLVAALRLRGLQQPASRAPARRS